MSSLRSKSYSNDCINEVCSSTASLSVSSGLSSRDYDSPTVVSQSSSSAHSDQFDDAPEDHLHSIIPPHHLSDNPLDALALACVAKKQERKVMQIPEPIMEGGTQQATSSFQISQNDVLCGRGGLTNHHPGNVFFRRLVRMKQEKYLLATKREKAGVAKEIVEVIRRLTPSGRFLKKDPQNPGHWIEIGDRKAREKTSQALREGAPELREELQSTEVQENNGNHQQEVCPSSTQLETMKQVHYHNWPSQTLDSRRPVPLDSNRARLVSSEQNLKTYSVDQQDAHHYLETSQTSPSGPHVILDDYHLHTSYPPPKNSMYRHPQPTDVEESTSLHPSWPHDVSVGNKRKSFDPESTTESGKSQGDYNAEKTNARGPRLKLLKQRLRDGV